MRLHRLTLRDVKGVRERTVELPERGVVVIEGPNEVGKTTLLEAFDALLSFKSTSKAADVRALKPVDRDVPPFVEAEFTVGDTRVVYAKQWLRQPSTTLRVLGPRPEQLTGDVAQQRVDQLLGTHLDRTLWDALRLTQSGDGTVAPLMSSTVLTEALDAAAGAHQHADGADVLLDAVEKEWSTYWTPTGKPTGDYRAAMSRWTAAQDAVVDADRRVQEGAALLQRQQEARERVERAEQDLAGAGARLEEAQEAGAVAEQVAQTLAVAAERLTQARQLDAAATRDHDRRGAAAQELMTLQALVTRLGAERDAALEEAEGLTERHQALQDEAELSAADLEAAAAEVDAARADTQLLQDTLELVRREQLVERVTVLIERLQEAREALPSVVVGRQDARAVRSLQDRLGELLRQHDAVSPVLHVQSLGSAVQVELGDDAGSTAVEKGQDGTVVLAHDATVEVPGQARLRLVLQDEAHARVTRIAEVRAELEEHLARLAVADADEAERLADAAEAAQSSVREVLRDLDAALSPVAPGLVKEAATALAVPAAVLGAVQEADRVLQEGMALRDQTRPLPEDLAAARTVESLAEARYREARQLARQAQARVAEVRDAVAAVAAQLQRADGRISSETERLAVLQGRLAEERAHRGDEDLAREVDASARRLESAVEEHDAAQTAAREADVEGARSRLASARHHHRLVTAARESALGDLHTISGQVEMAAGEGRQELHDRALVELQEAERSLAAIDRHARAVRHLRTSLHRHRDAAHRAYVRPYTQALEELGRRVYGHDFAVVVDDQLALASRTLDGATVPFADLSGGAKEQLGILARLAVAHLVDPAHGVPVVIDDALGYSDPQRLRQMGEVLGSAGITDDLQVILLTCTPERYSSIPDVSTIRLTA